MARPRTFDEDDVVQTAMELFWTRGYAQTSLSDVYAATGLKPSSLYATFTDKETLFRRAFDRYVAYFQSTLPAGREGLAAIEDWLRTLLRVVREDPARRGCLIVNTLMERDAHSRATLAVAQRRLGDIRRFFVAQLERAVARGELAPDLDVAVAADGLLGAVMALMTLARTATPAAALQHVVVAALAALPRVVDPVVPPAPRVA